MNIDFLSISLKEYHLAVVEQRTGSQGRSRVHARRALAYLLQDYKIQKKGVSPPGSAYSVLVSVSTDPDLPEEIQLLTNSFIQSVNTDHDLPGIDLLANFRQIFSLLGYPPSKMAESKLSE
jgi:hypothetical protein